MTGLNHEAYQKQYLAVVRSRGGIVPFISFSVFCNDKQCLDPPAVFSVVSRFAYESIGKPFVHTPTTASLCPSLLPSASPSTRQVPDALFPPFHRRAARSARMLSSNAGSRAFDSRLWTFSIMMSFQCLVSRSDVFVRTSDAENCRFNPMTKSRSSPISCFRETFSASEPFVLERVFFKSATSASNR